VLPLRSNAADSSACLQNQKRIEREREREKESFHCLSELTVNY
jgi:hypothetical protein